MNWILDNLQLVLLIAGGIAYWLNQRRREREGQEADYDGDGIPDSRPAAPSAEDEQDRTRRIQEEIRRRILERRRGPSAPTMEAPRRDVPPEIEPPIRVPEWLRPEPETPPPIDEEQLARQRALQERLRQLAAERAATAKRPRVPSPIAESGMAPVSYGTNLALEAVRRDLADPAALRRAIIVREVLGPPVGLR